MKTAEQILKDMPSIKQGLDDFYGRQTVLNALNLALSQGQTLPIDCVNEPLRTVNTPQSKGMWSFERSSGYAGYRCSKCKVWVYSDNPRRCECDE